MKKTKSRGIKDNLFIIIPIAAVVIVVIVIARLLMSSYHNKQCKATLNSLATNNYQIFTEHNDVRVKFNSENLPQLSYYFNFAKMWAPKEETDYDDFIVIEFKGESDWTVTIYEVDKDTLKYVIEGDKDYEFMSPNNGYFDDLSKLLGEEGWTIKNKVIQKF